METLIPGKSPARAQSHELHRGGNKAVEGELCSAAQGAGTAQKHQECNTTGVLLSATTAAGLSPDK